MAVKGSMQFHHFKTMVYHKGFSTRVCLAISIPDEVVAHKIHHPVKDVRFPNSRDNLVNGDSTRAKNASVFSNQ